MRVSMRGSDLVHGKPGRAAIAEGMRRRVVPDEWPHATPVQPGPAEAARTLAEELRRSSPFASSGPARTAPTSAMG